MQENDDGTEGEKAVSAPIVAPKEKSSAGRDADRVLGKGRLAAVSEKEERCVPDGSSSAFQEGSVGEAQDDGGGGGVLEGSRSSGGGDGEDGQGKIKIGEPTNVPVSSGRDKQSASQNRTESDQPTTAECSTDSANTAVVTRETGVATQVTWRGQPVALAGPIVITLRESGLRKLRFGRRIYHKPGTKALAGDSEYDLSSSDEGSDVRLAAARVTGQSKSTKHKAAQGRDRDGKRGGPTKSGSSKRGSSAQRNSISSSPPFDVEAKEEEHHADRKNYSHCRQEEALPLDRAGSSAPMPPRRGQGPGSGARIPPRQAVFLPEPYVGPPVAACLRTWPAGTRVMADPTEGCRRRSHRARHESSESYGSRRARRKFRRAGGRKKKRSSDRTRLGSSSSPTTGGTTSSSSSSSSGSGAFAREDKEGGGPRAESKGSR